MSNVRYEDLAAVAVTSGPGLAYCLEVGIKKAKEIAATYKLPLIGVNHMEGHALTARLTNPEVEFPFLGFLVSGGHTQLTLCKGVGEYMHLGGTLDNALGMVYDKVARDLDLLYGEEGVPGGEAVERLAKQGDATVYSLGVPMARRVTCDFSFSGIMSNMQRTTKAIKEKGPLSEKTKADLAATFQQAVLAHVATRTTRALAWSTEHLGRSVGLVVSGGVARNNALRERLNEIAESAGVRAVYPPARLCTDNGVMIAWAGIERLQAGFVDSPDDVIVRPRWPLDKSGKTHFPSTTNGRPDTNPRHKANYVVKQ